MKKKNIFIIVLSSCLIVGLLLFLVLFLNIPRIHYSYDASTDSYHVDKIYGNASKYVIPDSKDSKPVTKILARVFMNKTGVKEIELGKNIKTIERMAFLNCTKLEKINLESIETIGRNAFENCTSLKRVELNIEDLMGGTFLGCESLMEVVLTNTKTIGSYAFSSTGIESISIPQTCYIVGDYAFYNCNKLKKILVYSKSLSNNSYLKALEGVEFLG